MRKWIKNQIFFKIKLKRMGIREHMWIKDKDDVGAYKSIDT